MYFKHPYFKLPLVLLAFLPVPALANGWEILGERSVNFKAEKDTIRVGPQDGKFRKIKLKVKKNGIHLIDLKIHYANGEVQDVAIRSLIRPGGETRVIDLEGNKRIISKITMRYQSLNKKKGKSTVRVFGKH